MHLISGSVKQLLCNNYLRRTRLNIFSTLDFYFDYIFLLCLFAQENMSLADDVDDVPIIKKTQEIK